MILGPDWLAVLSHEVLLVVLELAGLALLEDVLGPALAFTLAELPSPTLPIQFNSIKKKKNC